MQVRFVVHGPPVGKGRPRFTKRGKVYTPEKTAAYEALVALMYRKEAHGFTSDKPIRVEIMANFSPPQKATKAKKEQMLQGSIAPTKKPDADNIGKIILDALNGLAYKDDTQVVELLIGKRYDTHPYVVVNIKELEADRL